MSRPTTGRTCHEFVATKWDNLCKNCRTTEAQHATAKLSKQITNEELAHIAEEKRAKCEALMQVQLNQQRHKEEVYNFFHRLPFCAQRTISFKADDGSVDERVVKSRVPFHDSQLPREILEAIFRQLGPRDKNNMRRTCVALFARLSELSPGDIVVESTGHVVGQSVTSIGYHDVYHPYVTIPIRFVSKNIPKMDDLKCGIIVCGYSDPAVIAPVGPLESMREGLPYSFGLSAFFDGASYSRYCEKTGKYYTNDSRAVKELTRFLGQNCFLQPYVENAYGLSLASAIHVLVPQGKEIEAYYYCFSEEAPIHMANGETTEARKICVGDRLSTPEGKETTVTAVKTTPHYCEKGMVDMGDYLITVGHPIFVNGEWYRPDELYPVVRRYVTCVYNFYCQPHHFIVVGNHNPTIASSLGGYCPRIAEMDPYTDILYGSGYGTELALRYAWLLTLKERIPDESVEEETEKYWARQNAIELPLQDRLLLSY